MIEEEDKKRQLMLVAVGFGISYVLSKFEPFLGTIGSSFTFLYLASVLTQKEEEPIAELELLANF